MNIGTGRRGEFWRESRDNATHYTWSEVERDAFSDWVARDNRSDDQASQAMRYVSPEMTGWEDLDLAIMQTNFCSAPVIFGGTTIFKYARLMQAGCCSAQGLDLQAMRDAYGKATVWDRRVNAVTGNDGFWVLAPGALAVLTYSGADQGLGMAQVLEGANYRKMTIQDPQSGLPIDLVISDNCGNVSITARTEIGRAHV